ncbi:MAG: RidA family protein [Chloroflexota bacterium]
MSHQRIASPDAPGAIGPYSQAIDTGSHVFCSGQLGMDPATGALVGEDVAAQTERALTNLGAVLAAAGLGYEHVTKTTCFLVDMADFAAFNEVYARFFREPYPARSTFAVAALPKAARVEVEAIAQRPVDR